MSQVTLWKNSPSVDVKRLAVVDWDLAIDLTEARPWVGGRINLTFPQPKATLHQVGLLANSASLPIVRRDLLAAFLTSVEECAEVVPCILHCSDGTSTEFGILHVIRTVEAADLTLSKIRHIAGTKKTVIAGFDHLVLKNVVMPTLSREHHCKSILYIAASFATQMESMGSHSDVWFADPAAAGAV